VTATVILVVLLTLLVAALVAAAIWARRQYKQILRGVSAFTRWMGGDRGP